MTTTITASELRSALAQARDVAHLVADTPAAQAARLLLVELHAIAELIPCGATSSALPWDTCTLPAGHDCKHDWPVRR